MKTLKLFIAAAILLIHGVHAQNVPLTISYQAILIDDSGTPLADTVPQNFPVVFRIYDSVQGSGLLWSESQNISVFKGAFSTLLGTGEEVTDEPRPPLNTIFNQRERFLQITITEETGDKTFTPRQQMVSAPFAFRSSVAERVVVIDDDAVGTAQIDDKAVDLNALADVVLKRLVPAGSVTAWAGLPSRKTLVDGVILDGIPEGWILCDGRSVSKLDFPDLFAAIGYLYGGAGDNFNVPDYQGYFLRAQSINTTQDPDRGLRTQTTVGNVNNLLEGSGQFDQLKSHLHQWSHGETSGGSGDANNQWDTGPGYQSTRTYNTTNAGGSETRPKNKYVHYIIKAH